MFSLQRRAASGAGGRGPGCGAACSSARRLRRAGSAGAARNDIVYFNLNTREQKVLSKAPGPEPKSPFDVVHCGTDAFFAVAGAHELAVYRSVDGTRLASAPAKKGGALSLSASGCYLTQTRNNATTIFRLEP
ncbi:hypothetical protein LZC95_22325 [Pendulispora brunnea]|uniref:Uncharacterized protein n=1 Tax=Pendulispora brunnea TaxID=2905690 RepID=A0ABZ2KLK3_9BACT